MTEQLETGFEGEITEFAGQDLPEDRYDGDTAQFLDTLDEPTDGDLEAIDAESDDSSERVRHLTVVGNSSSEAPQRVEVHHGLGHESWGKILPDSDKPRVGDIEGIENHFDFDDPGGVEHGPAEKEFVDAV